MSIYLKLNELQQQINNISTRGITTAGTANLTSGLTSSAILVSQGNFQVGTDGKGVDFSAASNTVASSGVAISSELFKDYKEGTWIPQISGSSTIGTVSHTNQVGRFTKIGRMVFINAYISWSGDAGSAPAGNLIIGNLPFTVRNDDAESTGVFQYTNLTVPASSIAFVQAVKNTTTLKVLSIATAGASSAALTVDPTASCAFSLAYEAA